MNKDQGNPAFGVKGALTSGDWVVPKRGPQKVVKKWGKAGNKKRKK